MDKTIFLVMYAYYSDWQIYGYFTNRDEAEKYVVSHPSEELDIHEIECLDNQADLSNVSVKYEFPVFFEKNDSEWVCHVTEDFDIYQSLYLRNNFIYTMNHDKWIKVFINLDKRDKDLAKKIAQDIFYQYMSECDGRSSEKSMIEFNKILSAEEERKKELAEFERLKAKYE